MKFVGSLLIIISTVAISGVYEKRKKQSLTSLKLICSFLEHAKCQIELFSLPISRVYEQYAEKNEQIYALICGKHDPSIPNDIEAELFYCFSNIGKSYKDEEIKKLDYALLKLKRKIEQYEKESSQKIKVFRAISIFLGCSTVILLA